MKEREIDLLDMIADILSHWRGLLIAIVLGAVLLGAFSYTRSYRNMQNMQNMQSQEAEKMLVRLHTGDPSIYGAIREQMDELDRLGIPYESCPGVSACFGAAASLNLEYTLPGVSQTLIITRMEGRTPVPSKESIQSFAAHQATMVVFLSTGMLEELSRRLIEGGYTADTPAAIVYKATWPEQKTFVCTVGTLAKTAAENNITKTALMIIGDTVAAAHYDRSKLYDPEFTTEFREAVKSKTHHS